MLIYSRILYFIRLCFKKEYRRVIFFFAFVFNLRNNNDWRKMSKSTIVMLIFSMKKLNFDLSNNV